MHRPRRIHRFADHGIDTTVAPATRSRRPGGRVALRVLTAIGAVLALGMLASAAVPASASAAIDIPNPLDVLPSPLSPITGGIGKLAVGAFDAIVQHLFAPITKLVTAGLIGWLVTVPNLAEGTHVARLETTVTAMGGGLLGAVATMSIARYWLVGYAGNGFAALEGLARTVAAALALAAWPWAFAQAVNLTNLFTGSLMSADSVVKPCATLLAGALGAAVALSANPLGLFLELVIAIAALLLFFGLLLLKVAVSLTTILVFVGMPLAIVLWPIAPWVLNLAGRALIACLAVPALWALCFATAAAVTADAATLSGGGPAIDKVIQPLIAIVLLYLMIKLPFALARIAMIGSQALSGGFVARTASYAAGRSLADATRHHRPTSPAGPTPAIPQRGTGNDRGPVPATAARAAIAAAGGGVSTAATVTAAAAAGAPATAGAAVSGAGRSVPGYRPPPTAQAQAAGGASRHGLPTPAFRREDFEAEMFEAEHRAATDPPTLEHARRALQTLPGAARRDVGEALHQSGSGDDPGRRELAYRATAGEWTAEQREAIRTLAAAAPDVRAQAVASRDEPGAPTGQATPAGEPLLGDRPEAPASPPGAQPIAARPSVAPGAPRSANGDTDGRERSAPEPPGSGRLPPPRDPRADPR